MGRKNRVGNKGYEKIHSLQCIRIVSLVSLAIGCKLTLAPARALRFVDEVEGYISKLKHETGKECKEQGELVILSTVLYEAFSMLISRGKKLKECVALDLW